MPFTDDDREMYRQMFAGIVQGSCEECGNCSDDCPCDSIIDRLVDACERIHDDPDQPST
jgi:predicted molibdopterin-dependent oxidoreductase YjgC